MLVECCKFVVNYPGRLKIEVIIFRSLEVVPCNVLRLVIFNDYREVNDVGWFYSCCNYFLCKF